MVINDSIFKAYDIRGTFPDELNSEVAYMIGASLTSFLKPRAIAVGRDMRLSSEELFESLARGINENGVDVIDLGLCSTDGLYFAVGKYHYDGGVMITASHNPKEYNGFKICRKNAEPLSRQDGMKEMLEMINADSYRNNSPQKGMIIRKDVSEDYANHCLSFIDVDKIKPYHIVIDAGNGMAGATLQPVLDQLPIKVTKLFFELDGTFPNHPASPIELENLQDIKKKILEVSADFGAAFDGDADRVFLLDRDGNQIGGDITTALVTKSLLSQHKNETVLYNLICSRAVPELIERMGGTPVKTRVGHALIKPLMKKQNAIFGGEHSGHFYFRDNWFADSGLIAFLVCLELISVEGRDLKEMVAEIDPYFRSGEQNSRVDSIAGKIALVRDAYKDGEQDELDGLTVNYKDWWFNLRPSNTEPLLRLNVEADSKPLLEEQTAALLKLIRS